MTAAEPEWLDLRVPFDDAAREHSLSLLDLAAPTLSAVSAQVHPGGGTEPDSQADAGNHVDVGRPLVVIDIGAGTGNSMRWFDHHLRERLPGRPLSWVLLDADAASLEIAAERSANSVRAIVAPISSLPAIAAEVLTEVTGETPASDESFGSCDLLITGSALLDVLTRADMKAISDTVRRFSGIGIFVLNISGEWSLRPPHPDDGIVGDAFDRHQRRSGRLGTESTAVLAEEAYMAGAEVRTSESPWTIEAPRDIEFLSRFLTERIDAAVEEEPQLVQRAHDWLDCRLNQSAELRVVVDHTDILIDATPTATDTGTAAATASTSATAASAATSTAAVDDASERQIREDSRSRR